MNAAVIHFTAHLDAARRPLTVKVEEAQRAYVEAIVEDHGPSARAQAASEALKLEDRGVEIGRLARGLARDFGGSQALISPADRINVAALITGLVQAFDPSTADAQNIMEASALRECGL